MNALICNIRVFFEFIWLRSGEVGGVGMLSIFCMWELTIIGSKKLRCCTPTNTNGQQEPPLTGRESLVVVRTYENKMILQQYLLSVNTNTKNNITGQREVCGWYRSTWVKMSCQGLVQFIFYIPILSLSTMSGIRNVKLPSRLIIQIRLATW